MIWLSYCIEKHTWMHLCMSKIPMNTWILINNTYHPWSNCTLGCIKQCRGKLVKSWSQFLRTQKDPKKTPTPSHPQKKTSYRKDILPQSTCPISLWSFHSMAVTSPHNPDVPHAHTAVKICGTQREKGQFFICISVKKLSLTRLGRFGKCLVITPNTRNPSFNPQYVPPRRMRVTSFADLEGATSSNASSCCQCTKTTAEM